MHASLPDFLGQYMKLSANYPTYRRPNKHEVPKAPGQQALVEIIRNWIHYSNPSSPSEDLKRLALSWISREGFSRVSAEKALKVIEEAFGDPVSKASSLSLS